MKGGYMGWRVDRRVGEWIDELENRYMDWRVARWVGDPFLTFHFCPKSLKRSFSTNFSPISKISQPIEQDTALIPFCYVL